MCHVSVGHVARAVEEAGIPTVTIMTRAFAHRSTEMMIPRSLVVNHPMGHSLGAAFDVERQSAVLSAALDLLESAPSKGTVAEFGQAFRLKP